MPQVTATSYRRAHTALRRKVRSSTATATRRHRPATRTAPALSGRTRGVPCVCLIPRLRPNRFRSNAKARCLTTFNPTSRR
ncbi:hypothetical protein [Lysobacter gummosus]|uniref:hypothetical protein n=1 Tax=Lysobacter gummosus TaxID=262324 RepID=UPI0036362A3A